MEVIIDARVNAGLKENNIIDLFDKCCIYEITVIGTKEVTMSFADVQALSNVYGVEYIIADSQEDIAAEAAKCIAKNYYMGIVVVSKDSNFRALQTFYKEMGHTSQFEICRSYMTLKELLTEEYEERLAREGKENEDNVERSDDVKKSDDIEKSDEVKRSDACA